MDNEAANEVEESKENDIDKTIHEKDKEREDKKTKKNHRKCNW